MELKTKNKTALVFGATGLVGKELTQLILEDGNYDTVKVFIRNPISLRHPKLKQVVNNLEKPEDLSVEIMGDDLFCCLGTTIKKARTREAFEWADLHLPLKTASIASVNGVNKIIAVSSIGANIGSKNFYLRTKGKMEAGILSLNFKNIYLVRPSLLLGQRDERRSGEQFGKIFMSVFSVFFTGRLKKYKGINARTVASAMIKLVNSDEKNNIFESDKLELLAK